MSTSDSPLTDAVPVSLLPGDHYGDVKRLLEHARRLERDRAMLRDALALVCELASLEWQEADGARKGATDNAGKRLWFIGDEVMTEARAALAATEDKS